LSGFGSELYRNRLNPDPTEITVAETIRTATVIVVLLISLVYVILYPDSVVEDLA